MIWRVRELPICFRFYLKAHPPNQSQSHVLAKGLKRFEGFESFMARILWGSEQPLRPTGYAVVSREIIKRLIADYGHEVHVIGWDYNGEDFKHEEGWILKHCGLQFGASEPLQIGVENSPTVLDYHLQTVEPDVYLSLVDCWFCGHMVQSTNKAGVPYIGYFPIDGVPISNQWTPILAHTHTPLWMSEFGRQQFKEFVAKYRPDGNGHENLKMPDLDRFNLDNDDDFPMIHHGVDIDTFKPLSLTDKEIMRGKLGIKWETVLSSIGRNTNRKQIPRLLRALRIALDKLGDDNAIGIILHCGDPLDQMNQGGWKLPELIKQYELVGNVMFSDGSSNPLHGISREDIANLLGCSDAHVLATGGEGFGIPSAEAMGVGIPIILPDNSTGPELIGLNNERGWLVPCSDSITGPRWGVDLGLVDIEALADTLIELHQSPIERIKRGKAARKFVVENLDWDLITRQFHDLIESRIGMNHPMQELLESRAGGEEPVE